VGVPVGVSVEAAVPEGVEVAEELPVSLPVEEGVGVGVRVEVEVLVWVGVFEIDRVEVGEGGIGESEGVLEAVPVCVRVGVGV
jgi:hypothetical protein